MIYCKQGNWITQLRCLCELARHSQTNSQSNAENESDAFCIGASFLGASASEWWENCLCTLSGSTYFGCVVASTTIENMYWLYRSR